MTVTPANNHSFVELHVPNVKESRDFYLTLGFKLVWEIDTYVVLKFDKSLISLNLEHLDPPLGRGAEIAIQVESQPVEKYFEFIKTLSQVNIAEPLTRQPWGKWDFRIYDNNGYYLRFTEPENILYP